MRDPGSTGDRAGSWSIGNRVAILLVLALMLTPFVSSCGTPSFSGEVVEKLEKILDKEMSEHDIPGAVVGVWVPGEGEWVVAKGKADVETGRAMKTTDRFRIASTGKTFTATIILKLVDEGKLSLDDTLEKYVPRVPNSAEITIRQLLNMTSGIPDYANTPDGRFEKIMVEQPLKKWTPDEFVDFALSYPSLAPGGEWSYSNTNYILLGIIIEQLTGKKIGELTEDMILDPLKLENTSFATGTKMPGEHAHGYFDPDGDGTLEDITELDPSQCWASGAHISNLGDLKLWAKALAEGELISEKSHEEQLTFVEVPAGPLARVNYGLGVFNFGGFIGHEGKILGYNCAMYYLPSRDATIVVLLNEYCEGSVARDIFFNVAETVLPDDVPRYF